MRSTPFLLVVTLLLLGSCKLFLPAPTDVEVRYILVRHAEKLDQSADPPLTEAGKSWADSLATLLQPLAVGAIYASEFERTEATARPTALQNDRPIMAYDPRDLPLLVERLNKSAAKGTILVVGHSNTTPKLANLLLGEERYTKIDESDYGDVFVVTRLHNGSVGATQYQSIAAAQAALAASIK